MLDSQETAGKSIGQRRKIKPNSCAFTVILSSDSLQRFEIMKPDEQESGSSPLVQISLLLPAYNEEKGIANTISLAIRYFERKSLTFEVVVIADGTDRTREIVAEMAAHDSRVRLLGGKERRGKGYALRIGVRESRGRFIGFVDADNKTPIEQFDTFLPHLEAGIDVAMGTRRHPGARIERQQPWFRRIGSTVFGIFMHSIVGLRDIPDTQCGFKFFPREVAKKLFSLSFVDGYIYDVEILFLSKKLGYRIEQIPIRWSDDGDSRLGLVFQNMQNFWDVVRIRFHRYPK
jgi:dolichyl-phosphate beta-glucosyltransferase